jgi:predicted component of type VI protein secretion system
LTFICALALIALTLLSGCHSPAAKKDEHSESKKAPAQITVENGRTLITLDEPTQQRLGFTVATLTSTVTRAQATFPALVLSVQELATFRNTYVAGQTQLQKARLQADLAGKEYTRLKALFAENQNISEKSLQSAEAALQSDEADVHAAEQQLNLQASSIRQEWGDVVTKWVTEGSAQFQRILDGSQALIEMTVLSGTTSAPPGSASPRFAPPTHISIELPSGARINATFVSTFFRVDPRMQGSSFLYLAPGQPRLPSGLNLVAHLPVGTPLKGVVIPASAVIWSEGKAWVYAQVSPDGFTRTPLATDLPVEDGFFAAAGFSAGDKIVTVGAQALLSEEMLLHSPGGGAGDGN